MLVTVKSGATAEIAASILRHAPASAAVVSLQNGVDNAAILEEALPGRNVVAGMVPFNVAALGDGRFHRGTDGTILIDAKAAALAAALCHPAPADRHASPTCTGRLGQAAAQPQQRAQRARRRAAARGDRQPRLAAPARELHRRGAAALAAAGIRAGEGRRLAAGADPEGAAPARRAVPPRRRGAAADRSEGALVDGRRPAAATPHRDRPAPGPRGRARRRPGHAGAGESRRAGAGEGGRGEGRGVAPALARRRPRAARSTSAPARLRRPCRRRAPAARSRRAP